MNQTLGAILNVEDAIARKLGLSTSAMDKVRNGVNECIAQELDVPLEKVTDKANLREDLVASDLGLTEMTLAIEKKFDIFITDEETKPWKTVEDVIETVANKVHK
ncbi:HpcH/HpaI aldolase/citrate lyase family protein [Penicillium lagena]|uniref:HpcH/HpaI aldolase/citrate lyase family protein n=1 Tax=Penicillium lagena TaxID=94218 RepID=UPI002540455A|nr:HpcH/HpaI aldolase/citrate lyase family protein [Penicillium lagena]KAJ5618950.1 HpcH/HpaI aldolase/citrate lyase family protein [Penicillium lagena]